MSVDRGFTWMDDETLALIEIWGKSDIQSELGNAKRNFSVYEKIARELSDIGFSRTAYQCREKIKRLRKEYQLARYCLENNISQKKPMKYFEQVDGVLNRGRAGLNADVKNVPSSEVDSDMRFSFTSDMDSNPVTNNDVSLQPVMLWPPTADGESKPENVGEDRSFPQQEDSNDTVIGNDDEDVEALNKEYDIEEGCPWVPNVVLVENDQEGNSNFDGNVKEDLAHLEFDEKSSDKGVSHKDRRESQSTVEDEPPLRKLKLDSKASWFKTVMDKVTEKFIDYQKNVDSQFLERIAFLERERIKRDEAMQKMWMEFEERQRKDEQQHELKVMALFGQFVNQILENRSTEEDA